MKEQLISFETAKLAKEKGFNKSFYVWGEASYIDEEISNNFAYGEPNDAILAPTQSLLQKWLREKHEIHINICTYYFTDIEKYEYEIEDIIYNGNILIYSESQGKYEDVLEFGLQEALKLIKI